MTGTLRNPTGQVSVCGINFIFDTLDISLSRTKKGDTFTATGSMTANDIETLLTSTNTTATASINGAALFQGVIDHSDYDFEMMKVTVSGRDKGSKMIDAQTSEKFLNQTPSSVIQTIAARHGLQTDIDPIVDDAGKMLSTDWDAISHRFSEWSWINRFADQFGLVAYMTGGTLYVKQEPESLPTYNVNWSPPTPQQFASGNFVKLKCSRNHILGRPVTVNARSHHHRDKKVYSATAQSNGGSGDPLIYNMTIPLVRTETLQRIAQKKLYEVQSHELKLDQFEFPGDETVTARMSFQLSGTGTPLDQSYEGETIKHSLKFDGGFVTSVTVKNKKKGS